MIVRTLISALFFFSTFLCCAQRSEVDSLENLIQTAPSDTTKVLILNRLVTTLREGDTKKALVYARQARELAQVLNYQPGLASALENLGWLSYRRGDYSTAFQFATDALSILEYHHDYAAIARCLNSIAAIYYEQKQYDAALNNFKRALNAARLGNDEATIARSLNNIAFTMLYLNQDDSATYYVERGLIASQKAKSRYLEGYAYRTMGDIDLRNQKVETGLAKFWNAMLLADKVDNRFLKASTLHRVAKAYMLLNQPDEALKYLTENILVAKQFGYSDELEKALKLTADVYTNKNMVAEAYKYQSQYIHLHDSLYDQRNNEHLALMHARFESQLKQVEIELLKRDKHIKQQEINSQRLWMYFTIGLLSLTAILVFVLLYSNWLKRKANRLLGVKNKEIQEQASQLSNLNVTKDKLLSIISHDVRGPLASLRGLINIVCRGGLTQDEFIEHSLKVRHNLDSVQEDLDNLLYWAQSQLTGLQIHPEPVKVRDVVNDKIRLFKVAADRKDILIINDVADSLTAFSDKNHLGLVVRNLLANAIKFNLRGGSIHIGQKIYADHVEIFVKDSGVGINPGDVKKLFNAQTHFSNLGTDQEKGIGIGLLLTKEFVEKSGGSIWVTSEVGKGSTFTFTTKCIVSAVEKEIQHA